jgi:uncharacterized protein
MAASMSVPHDRAAASSVDDLVWVDDLDEAVCWKLLAATAVGRIGFVEDGRPDVLPVNHRVAGDVIVFRTGSETRLHGLDGAAVVFEADELDGDEQTGWSVIVRGHLAEVADAEGRAEMLQLSVQPWAPGPRDHWMQIEPTAVTGRAISRVRSRPDGSLHSAPVADPPEGATMVDDQADQ